MDINGVFPSTYVKAADLQGGKVVVTIDRVSVEEVGGEHKPVIYFSGKEKGLVLNKTNAAAITGIYGAETNNWSGSAITLFATQTEFQGRPVACIRVEINAPVQQQQAPPAPQQVLPPPPPSAQMGDVDPATGNPIPF